MRIQRFFPSFFLFLSVCVPGGSVPADEYAGFIRDALQKWDEYLSGLADMECTVRVTTHYPPDPEQYFESTVVFNYPYFALETFKNGSVNEVRCYGKRYLFRLIGDNETNTLKLDRLGSHPQAPDLSYWLDTFSRPDRPNDDWYITGGGRVTTLLVARSLHLYAGTWLPTLFRSESFSVDSLTEDGERFCVDFKFEPESDMTDPDFLSTPVRSGRLVLLKDSYLPESADFGLQTGPNERRRELLSFEYAEVAGKTVLKSKKEEWSQGGDAFYTLYSFDNIRFKKERSSRFTLSHYGLPEPDFEGRSVRRIFVLLGCAFIFYALFRLYRERRAGNGGTA